MTSDQETSFKRPQFGNRNLPNDDESDEVVFSHNAW